MKKSQLNFIIDVVMLVLMMLAAGIGLLMKYILLPGFARNLKYGRDVELYFWNLDRHQWGSVHLIVSLVLVALVILHIVLHWQQIKCIYRSLVRTSKQRLWLTISLVGICLLFSLGPLLIKPTVHASQGHNVERLNEKDSVSERRGLNSHQIVEQQEDDHHSLSEEIPIYGYMTITDVAQKYNVSASGLARHIGVPVSESGRKLGQLRRQYGFQMSAVRAFIEKNRSEK